MYRVPLVTLVGWWLWSSQRPMKQSPIKTEGCISSNNQPGWIYHGTHFHATCTKVLSFQDSRLSHKGLRDQTCWWLENQSGLLPWTRQWSNQALNQHWAGCPSPFRIYFTRKLSRLVRVCWRNRRSQWGRLEGLFAGLDGWCKCCRVTLLPACHVSRDRVQEVPCILIHRVEGPEIPNEGRAWCLGTSQLQLVARWSCAKWWFNGNLPWYKVKSHLKQITLNKSKHHLIKHCNSGFWTFALTSCSSEHWNVPASCVPRSIFE